MRNAQWMVQAIGVDGFRVDAAKHFPEWVLDYVDQAVFRANPRLQHDGSIQPVFMFSEVLDGNQGLLQSYIRQDLPNPTAISPANTTVAGNRDALDFPLFYAMRDNLSSNGLANNWHQIRNASQDTHDDGQNNGSQGVSFVDSHDNLDGGFPHLKNVAYAYTLMRPGNAIVYFNAKEFGEGRDFPNDGKEDALGGLYGE
jgi:glycosidase